MAPSKNTRHKKQDSLAPPSGVKRSHKIHQKNQKEKEKLEQRIVQLKDDSEDPRKVEKIASLEEQIKTLDEDEDMEDVRELPGETYDHAASIKQEEAQSNTMSSIPTPPEDRKEDNSAESKDISGQDRSGNADTSDNLFVEQKTKASVNNDDDLSALTLEEYTKTFGLGGGKDESDEHEGWTKGQFGHEKIILRFGPRNAAKYQIKSASELSTTILADKTKNLSRDRAGERKNDEEKHIYPKGSIVDIQGVAWEYPDNKESPMQLLNPANWPAGRTGKRYSPLTLIHVKLLVPTAEGEPERFETSWETRTTVQRLYGNRQTTLGKDLTLDGTILVPKDQSIGRADARIIIAAHYHELRHRQFLKRERKASSKSPTPDGNDEVQRLRDMSPTPAPTATS